MIDSLKNIVVDKSTFDDKLKELKEGLVTKEEFDKQTIMVNTLKVCTADKEAVNALAKEFAEFKEIAAEKEELYTLQAAVKKLKEKTSDGFNKVKE